jgi:hypothetical protein
MPYTFIAGVIGQLLDQVQGSCFCISPDQLQGSNLALLYRQPKTLGNQVNEEQVVSRKSKLPRKECLRNTAVPRVISRLTLSLVENRLRLRFKPIHWHWVDALLRINIRHNEQFRLSSSRYLS